jgi:CRISPR-associated exonuclease Cas4
MISLEIKVNGTLVWYYTVCKREVWLMSRNLTPDQDDENILKGKISQEEHYVRNKKEIAIDGIKVDMIASKNGKIVVSEIKKSSKYLEAATLQLKYYLYVLRGHGVYAIGEIRVPDERRVTNVSLEEQDIEEIRRIESEIANLISKITPPEAKKIRFCGKCAYSEFCWA